MGIPMARLLGVEWRSFPPFRWRSVWRMMDARPALPFEPFPLQPEQGEQWQTAPRAAQGPPGVQHPGGIHPETLAMQLAGEAPGVMREVGHPPGHRQHLQKSQWRALQPEVRIQWPGWKKSVRHKICPSSLHSTFCRCSNRGRGCHLRWVHRGRGSLLPKASASKKYGQCKAQATCPTCRPKWQATCPTTCPARFQPAPGVATNGLVPTQLPTPQTSFQARTPNPGSFLTVRLW